MKDFIKKISIGFFYTTLSIYRIMLNYKRSNFPKKGEESECVILGNGPSLKDFLKNNLDFIKDKSVICVNQMPLHESFEYIKPRYYILADPAYFNYLVSDTVKEIRNNLFSVIKKKVNWKLDVLVPHFKKRCELVDLENNPNITIYYYNSIPIEGFDIFKYFCYQHNFGTPIFQNVLVACLYIAINMSYKNIFLAGADHSWFQDIIVNEDNSVCLKNRHFYDKSDVKSIPFEKELGNNITFKMDEIMKIYSIVFKQYFILNEYAKKQKAEIYNITSNSCIDAFPRYKLTV